MSTRVWRLLDAELAHPRTNDALLRIVLVTAALDHHSALTPALRAWVLEQMPSRVAPFTPEERARLKTPLLAYVHDRLPRCVQIVRTQFDDDEEVP
jgi:hypothetical protein